MKTFSAVPRAVGLLLAMACARGAGTPRGEAGSSVKSIEQVLEAHRDSLMALPGVVGTAIGLCGSERCITVLVTDSAAARKARIPERLEGHQVRVEVSGPFQAR